MMRARRAGGVAALILAATTLGGCADNGIASRLRSAGLVSTPDEFLVLPTRPLEMPADLVALPPPTTGAPNRVDPRPEAEAVAALTGRPVAAGGASASTLIARSGGADPQIRARLAAEDLAYRQDNRGLLLERLASRDAEWEIYEDMRLDADAEFLRLRARGLRVPAAPPPR